MFAHRWPRVPEDGRTRPLNSAIGRKEVVMFAALGIMLLVAGALVTFAVDRSMDGIDVVAIGWILMAGGALALLVSMIHSAGWRST
jgi:hypothetical protein